MPKIKWVVNLESDRNSNLIGNALMKLTNKLSEHPYNIFTQISSVSQLKNSLDNDFLGLHYGQSELKKVDKAVTIQNLFSRFSMIKIMEFVRSAEFMELFAMCVRVTKMERVQSRQMLGTDCDLYYRACENIINSSQHLH